MQWRKTAQMQIQDKRFMKETDSWKLSSSSTQMEPMKPFCAYYEQDMVRVYSFARRRKRDQE